MPWTPIGVLKGSDGDAGTISSVTVTSLAPGATPTVTLGGTPSARTIQLGIPKGDTGDPATNFVTSVSGKQGVVTLVKADVGLSNVDNTSDAAKPVSTAQQTALNGKANSSHTHGAQEINDATTIGRSLISAASAGSARLVIGAGTSSLVIGTGAGQAADAAALATSLAAKAPLASPAFTGTPTGITKAHVGLGSVDNTADSAKPVSTAQATAIAAKADVAHTHVVANITDATVTGANVLKAVDAAAARTAIGAGTGSSNLVIGTTSGTAADAAALTTSLGLKANLASPAFTGTVTGITKAMVGLGSVDNTADTAKPVSTAQASALAAKADLVGGLVPTSQIPALAINEVFVVASEAAMLALTAQRGDMAIRETGRTYVLSSDSPATLADWKEVMAAGQVTSVAGKTGVVSLAKTDVGLANVDNTADTDKPISTATATALSGKAATAHTHTVANITDATVVGANVLKATDAAAARTAIGAGTSSLVIGTGAGQAADAAALATSLTAKAPLASPAFTGTPTGITKAHVGLGSVDNTSDATKPVSTAQASALAGKADVVHTHVATDISNSTTVGRSLLTAIDAPTARAAIGAGTDLPTQTGNGGKVLATNGVVSEWSATGTINTTDAPQPLGTPNPGTATYGAAAWDHVHPLPPSPLVFQQILASGTYTVDIAGTYEVAVVGSGGAGGGGGSSQLTTPVAQLGGAGGGSGVRQTAIATFTAGQVVTFALATAPTGGAGGAASTGATGSAGATGGQGSTSTATWTGGSVSAAGGAAGAGSAASTATTWPQQGNPGQPFFGGGGWPGSGAQNQYSLSSPGALDAGVGTGGGGGGAATTGTPKGGTGGAGGTRTAASASGGSAGASATTAGTAGGAGAFGGGGGGGGAGAAGGAGGQGGAGGAGYATVRRLL